MLNYPFERNSLKAHHVLYPQKIYSTQGDKAMQATRREMEKYEGRNFKNRNFSPCRKSVSY